MLEDKDQVFVSRQGLYSKIFLFWLVYLVPVIHFTYGAIKGIQGYFERKGQNDDAFILIAITLLIDIPMLLAWIYFTKRIKRDRLNSLHLYIIWVWALFALAYFYMVKGVWSAP